MSDDTFWERQGTEPSLMEEDIVDARNISQDILKVLDQVMESNENSAANIHDCQIFLKRMKTFVSSKSGIYLTVIF